MTAIRGGCWAGQPSGSGGVGGASMAQGGVGLGLMNTSVAVGLEQAAISVAAQVMMLSGLDTRFLECGVAIGVDTQSLQCLRVDDA